ncbi:Hsp20/alpha crystallin family protein [Planctomycetota bacterium]
MSLVPVKRRDSMNNELAGLSRQVDYPFGNYFRDWDQPMATTRNWPVLDIVEKDNNFVVMAEIPGIKREEVDISVTNSILSISGEKKAPEKPMEKGYVHSERVFGQFRRDINVGVDIDTGKIEATCENGILTITLPKSAKAMPMKIRVKEG